MQPLYISVFSALKAKCYADIRKIFFDKQEILDSEYKNKLLFYEEQDDEDTDEKNYKHNKKSLK